MHDHAGRSRRPPPERRLVTSVKIPFAFMICVTLGRSRHKRMIAEHQYLVEQGAKLVELRLDYLGRAVSLSRLLNGRPGPVVVTARRRGDGGRWLKSEQERLMLLRSSIAAGVEYIDIEADVRCGSGVRCTTLTRS